MDGLKALSTLEDSGETTMTDRETLGIAVDASDSDLVRAALDGRLGAFETLIRRYDQMLYRTARRLSLTHEEAQDVVQESFLKAFRKLEQFRAMAKFSTWLTRIAINESLETLRKRNYFRETSLDTYYDDEEGDSTLQIIDWGPNPEQRFRESELRAILSNALDQLRPILRSVFVLRDMEGLSAREAAELLDITEVVVRSRLFRARTELRRRLSVFFRPARKSRLARETETSNHEAAQALAAAAWNGM